MGTVKKIVLVILGGVQLFLVLGIFGIVRPERLFRVHGTRDIIQHDLRAFGIVKDAFLELKMLAYSDKNTQKEYPFLFLNRMNRNNLAVQLFDKSGSPRVDRNSGERGFTGESFPDHQELIRFYGKGFQTDFPLYYKEECILCHAEDGAGTFAGSMRFTAPYSSEKVVAKRMQMFFTLLALLNVLLIFGVIMCNPFLRIKELFDNSVKDDSL
jgi:hypothetical protein